MTEPRYTLKPGSARMYRVPQVGEGDGSVQVMTAVEPQTGEVVVMLRIGNIVSAIDPVAANLLADALKTEAAYAAVTGSNARWVPYDDDPGAKA